MNKAMSKVQGVKGQGELTVKQRVRTLGRGKEYEPVKVQRAPMADGRTNTARMGVREEIVEAHDAPAI